MYERHFGFRTKPFSLTPDPAFLYPSRQHAMGMTMLEYGLESQAAFSLLTGDIGCGKTMLVRHLLRGLGDRVVDSSATPMASSNPFIAGRFPHWESFRRTIRTSGNIQHWSIRS
jgi:type II secretory pathway predicted ATPase ExeA